MNSFLERHRKKIAGVLSCFDRVVITGTLADICYADGMARYLRARNIRLFDYPRWAEPLRQVIRENAERIAAEAGLEIDFIRRNNFRKEERIKEILRGRGERPGLVHIFSAMEACPSYRPWHDKKTGKTFLRPREAKCLHYYFYFIHEQLGLCYLRVPTWAPFRLQFYFNGHNLLAAKLKRAGIGYRFLENAFIEIEDFGRAQELAEALDVKALHRTLDDLAEKFCPVVKEFRSRYHWSLMQVEYSTDVVFKRRADLEPLYEAITYTAIHAVKPENVATFLGRKLDARYQGEVGNDFHTRIEGTRVMKVAPVKKTIYSLGALGELLAAANRRYLEFISAVDDPQVGMKRLDKISRPARDGARSHRGFNLFHGDDLDLMGAIVRGEFNISGFRNRNLQKVLPGKTGAQISRMLKRLHVHGIIRKIRNTYKYYLTHLGRSATMMALKLRELVVIPTLNEAVRT